MKCKICGSERIVKNGKGKWGQIYLCRGCKHQFVSEYGRHMEWEEKMAISLYCYGLSFRTIATMMLVNCSTIYRWVRAFAILHYEKPAPKDEIIVELDEMSHFIRVKKTEYGYGRPIVEQLDNLLTGNAELVIPELLKGCITG